MPRSRLCPSRLSRVHPSREDQTAAHRALPHGVQRGERGPHTHGRAGFRNTTRGNRSTTSGLAVHPDAHHTSESVPVSPSAQYGWRGDGRGRRGWDTRRSVEGSPLLRWWSIASRSCLQSPLAVLLPASVAVTESRFTRLVTTRCAAPPSNNPLPPRQFTHLPPPPCRTAARQCLSVHEQSRRTRGPSRCR